MAIKKLPGSVKYTSANWSVGQSVDLDAVDPLELDGEPSASTMAALRFPSALLTRAGRCDVLVARWLRAKMFLRRWRFRVCAPSGDMSWGVWRFHR